MLKDIAIDFSNSDTFLKLEDTAKDLRLNMEYRKTYSFPGKFIDGYHQWLSRCQCILII